MRDTPAPAPSLPDQVHGWPPKGNEHGYNRAARRQGAKDKRKAIKRAHKNLTDTLNAAAKHATTTKETPPCETPAPTTGSG